MKYLPDSAFPTRLNCPPGPTIPSGEPGRVEPSNWISNCRVILGSIERFIGILIEHYAGKFRLWLSPTQARVLPVSDKYLGRAKEVAKQLQKQGIRTETDSLPLSDRATDTISRPVYIIWQSPAGFSQNTDSAFPRPLSLQSQRQ